MPRRHSRGEFARVLAFVRSWRRRKTRSSEVVGKVRRKTVRRAFEGETRQLVVSKGSLSDSRDAGRSHPRPAHRVSAAGHSHLDHTPRQATSRFHETNPPHRRTIGSSVKTPPIGSRWTLHERYVLSATAAMTSWIWPTCCTRQALTTSDAARVAAGGRSRIDMRNQPPEP